MFIPQPYDALYYLAEASKMMDCISPDYKTYVNGILARKHYGKTKKRG